MACGRHGAEGKTTRTAINDVDVEVVVILVLVPVLGRVPAVRLRRSGVPLAVDGEVLHEAAERLLLHRAQFLLASFAGALELREVLPIGPWSVGDWEGERSKGGESAMVADNVGQRTCLSYSARDASTASKNSFTPAPVMLDTPTAYGPQGGSAIPLERAGTDTYG